MAKSCPLLPSSLIPLCQARGTAVPCGLPEGILWDGTVSLRPGVFSWVMPSEGQVGAAGLPLPASPGPAPPGSVCTSPVS